MAKCNQLTPLPFKRLNITSCNFYTRWLLHSVRQTGDYPSGILSRIRTLHTKEIPKKCFRDRQMKETKGPIRHEIIFFGRSKRPLQPIILCAESAHERVSAGTSATSRKTRPSSIVTSYKIKRHNYSSVINSSSLRSCMNICTSEALQSNNKTK